MIIEAICVGPLEVNCYVLASGENQQAILIDPGQEARKIKRSLGKYGLKPVFIINTHGHYDHIGADNEFGVPVYIHKDDAPLLRDAKSNLSDMFSLAFRVNGEIRTLEDNQLIALDDLELKVLHIPGHTPGGIALLMTKPKNKIVFTGDTLFCRGIGRSDLDGGNEKLLIKNIREKLLTLSEDTVIYPGHGPSSTIGQEKRSNPFLS